MKFFPFSYSFINYNRTYVRCQPDYFPLFSSNFSKIRHKYYEKLFLFGNILLIIFIKRKSIPKLLTLIELKFDLSLGIET